MTASGVKDAVQTTEIIASGQRVTNAVAVVHIRAQERD
jgi:hypothetical protein